MCVSRTVILNQVFTFHPVQGEEKDSSEILSSNYPAIELVIFKCDLRKSRNFDLRLR